MVEQKLTFEEALDRLDRIVEELESGGLSLEKTLAKFTDGVKLIQFCNSELNKAEQRIEMVLSENGDFTEIVSYREEEAQ